jgi:hypothetical protein
LRGCGESVFSFSNFEDVFCDSTQVIGCGSKSVQGDVAFANCLEEMGATVTWGDDDITVTRDPGTKLQGKVRI